MYVNHVQTLAPSTAKSRTRRAQGSGFASMLDPGNEADGPSSTAPSMAANSTAALFSLQEVEDPLLGRRKAVATSHSILDELEKLKVDLLSGRVSTQRLQRLQVLIDTQKDRDDPQLAQILAEVELRAAVELAKLGEL